MSRGGAEERGQPATLDRVQARDMPSGHHGDLSYEQKPRDGHTPPDVLEQRTP